MISPYGFLAYALLQIGTICLLFVALCDIARRAFGRDRLLLLCAGAALLGVFGYLSFWLAYLSYPVFGVAKIVVLAALLLRFGWIVHRRRLGEYRWLVEPLLYVSLFCVAVLSLGYSNGGLDDSFLNAEERFTHLLPRDNIIPWSIAVALRFGVDPTPALGDWLMSDRPPLQTGHYLLLVLRSRLLAYQVVSAWLQATFLLGVWGIACSAMLPVVARRLVLLACCLLPTAIINTFYVWPKLLSVGYLLLVFALLFRRRAETDMERTRLGILIGALTALALLSHGSSLFALIGFGVVVLVFWAWPPLKTVIVGGVTLLAVYAPWMLYQTLVEPPANRLLKWHFAGVMEIDDRSFLQALRDSYGGLAWTDYWGAKLSNLRALLRSWPSGLLDPLIGPFTGVWSPAEVRTADFFGLVPSLHVFAVAAIVAMVLFALMRRPDRAVGAKMLVTILATLVSFVLLMFIPGETINHQGTYAVHVMLTIFAFMVLTLRAPWLALLFIALQAVSVSATYAFSLPHDPRFWPLLAACGAATLFLVGYSLAPRFVRTG
jgi:hypothetical protein